MPQRYGVTFNNLPNGMANSLKRMVARGKTVGACGKAAVTWRKWVRIIGMNHLMGNKNRRAGSQIEAFDPMHAQIFGIAAVLDARQPRDIYRPTTLFNLAIRCIDHGMQKILCMPQFNSLH